VPRWPGPDGAQLLAQATRGRHSDLRRISDVNPGRRAARTCHGAALSIDRLAPMVPGMSANTRSNSQKKNVDELFRARGVAFLLSQVGAESSKRWAERLAALGLDSRRVMLFWHVALVEGRSQRELADALGLPETRIVALVDSLEEQGWIERRTSRQDRRARRLFMTERGREGLNRIMQVAEEHEAETAEGLSESERAQLVELLERLASTSRLRAGVHPDF
jgi:DNA-binding MarR family transcriptional regulator